MPRELHKLLQDFESGDLAPDGFSHEDHVAVAWQMLRGDDFLEAARRYTAGLRALTEKAGVPEKFNMTVTLAFLSVIAERMAGRNEETFEAFLANNRDLVSGNPLNAWYTKERLASASARTGFLMPDQWNFPAAAS